MNPGAEEGGRGGGAKERQRHRRVNSIPKTTSGNENELHCTALLRSMDRFARVDIWIMVVDSGREGDTSQSTGRSVVGALMESQHLSGS